MYWCGFRSALIHVGTFLRASVMVVVFKSWTTLLTTLFFCSLEVPDMYKVFIFCNAMLMCVCHYLPYSRYVMLFFFLFLFVSWSIPFKVTWIPFKVTSVKEFQSTIQFGLFVKRSSNWILICTLSDCEAEAKICNFSAILRSYWRWIGWLDIKMKSIL